MPENATIPWAMAADELLAAARARPGPAIIGITGPVGSGKTTLAGRLSACIISTDSYLPDYDVVPFHERDLPSASDLAALAEHLRTLRRGAAASIPAWSFHTHKREGMRRVEPAPIIVCEGIHALEATVSGVLDLRVYVDAPARVRWNRWEAMERSGHRGWGVDAARRFFDEVAEPTFARYADAYRSSADYIIINDSPS